MTRHIPEYKYCSDCDCGRHRSQFYQRKRGDLSAYCKTHTKTRATKIHRSNGINKREVKEKLCPRCGQTKPWSHFGLRIGRGGQPRSYCRSCDVARQKDKVRQAKEANSDFFEQRACKVCNQSFIAIYKNETICPQCPKYKCILRCPFPPGQEDHCRQRTNLGLWLLCEAPDEHDMNRYRNMLDESDRRRAAALIGYGKRIGAPEAVAAHMIAKTFKQILKLEQE